MDDPATAIHELVPLFQTGGNAGIIMAAYLAFRTYNKIKEYLSLIPTLQKQVTDLKSEVEKLTASMDNMTTSLPHYLRRFPSGT